MLQLKSKHLLIATVIALSASSVSFAGTIDPTFHTARVCHDSSCSTYGTINFLPTSSSTSISITNTSITGYAWGDELGWLNLAPTGAGVTVDHATGIMYGSAFSSVSGWVNFRPTNGGVTINSNGEFVGYAWASGMYGGWIKFDCSSASTCVKTDWRPTSSTTTPTTTPASNVQVLGASYFINSPISTSEVSSPNVTGQTKPPFSGGHAFNFTLPISYGSTSGDVKNLQLLLSTQKDIYPEGKVTGYFGDATKRAIQRFQLKYNIATPKDSGYGNVGPATRAKLNSLLVYTTESPVSTNTSNVSQTSNLPNKDIKYGYTSNAVKIFQAFLAKYKEIYPKALITGFFGDYTREAIKKFQQKFDIAKEGDQGYGEVGPKTRSKANELMK